MCGGGGEGGGGGGVIESQAYIYLSVSIPNNPYNPIIVLTHLKVLNMFSYYTHLQKPLLTNFSKHASI